MKKMNVALGLLVSISLLAACGNSNSAPGNTGSPAAASNNSASQSSNETKPKEKIQLNLWHAWGGSSQPITDALMEKYNSSQDEVEVVATFQGSYSDLNSKLQTSIAAKNQPELAIIERSTVINFAQAGALEPLNAADYEMDDFIPGLLSSTMYNDQLVSLPAGRSTPILYYNKAHFEEVGLTSAPATVDELKEYAEKLTISGQRVGFEHASNIWYFTSLVQTFGGRLINEEGNDIGFADNGAGVQALSFWSDMLDHGVMKMATAAEGDAAVLRDFVSGQASMIILSTGGLGIVQQNLGDRFELGTAFLPAHNGNLSVPTGGADIVMVAGADDAKKAAMADFVKWITATEQNTFISEKSGYVPTRMSVVESADMQSLYEKNPHYKVAVDQLVHAADTEIHEQWSFVSKFITEQMELSIFGADVTEEQAIDNIVKNAKEYLQP